MRYLRIEPKKNWQYIVEIMSEILRQQRQNEAHNYYALVDMANGIDS